MILKKPYGLLIKNFRKIHIILLVPMVYFTLKFSNIVKFLNDFIADGYITTIKNLTTQYLNFLIYIALIFIIAIAVAITYLMMSKKKSIKFYIIMIIYYIFCLVFMYIVYNFLMSIQFKAIEASTARIIRDVAKISYYIGYLIIIYTVIRGIGFDIKNFNFGEDLQDLDLSDEDSEEIELNIKLDRYEIERKIRSQLRDTKYYIFENKFIFTLITLGLSFFIIISLFLNIKVYNQTYKLNKVFNYNIFNVKITDTAIYKYDYKGKIISKDKSYLVIITEIENPTLTARAIGRDDFALYIDGKTALYPKFDRSGNFVDLASPYYGGKFQPQTKNTICLVYELTNSQIKNKYELRLLSSTVRDKAILIGRYTKVKLNPAVKDKKIFRESNKLKENISFSGTPLLNTKLKVNSFEIENRYEYKYDYCLEKKCIPSVGIVGVDYTTNGSGTLLILDTSLVIDENAGYAKYKSESRNFYANFIMLRYEYNNGKKYLTNLINRTPNNLKDKEIFQVNAEVAQAVKIDMIIRVRDKEITIKLK